MMQTQRRERERDAWVRMSVLFLLVGVENDILPVIWPLVLPVVFHTRKQDNLAVPSTRKYLVKTPFFFLLKI